MMKRAILLMILTASTCFGQWGAFWPANEHFRRQNDQIRDCYTAIVERAYASRNTNDIGEVGHWYTRDVPALCVPAWYRVNGGPYGNVAKLKEGIRLMLPWFADVNQASNGDFNAYFAANPSNDNAAIPSLNTTSVLAYCSLTNNFFDVTDYRGMSVPCNGKTISDLDGIKAILAQLIWVISVVDEYRTQQTEPDPMYNYSKDSRTGRSQSRPNNDWAAATNQAIGDFDTWEPENPPYYIWGTIGYSHASNDVATIQKNLCYWTSTIGASPYGAFKVEVQHYVYSESPIVAGQKIHVESGGAYVHYLEPPDANHVYESDVYENYRMPLTNNAFYMGEGWAFDATDSSVTTPTMGNVDAGTGTLLPWCNEPTPTPNPSDLYNWTARGVAFGRVMPRMVVNWATAKGFRYR